MEITEGYEVKLEIFEGPLDLLVFLVQKSELDPCEIPIATITDQYLEYMKQLEQHNLSSAGDFLVMASRLMQLKARELLPAEERDEMDEMELELDKNTLIEQMMEYQKYKEASKFLKHLEARNFGAFSRGHREVMHKEKSNPDLAEQEAGIYELMAAFSNAIRNRKKPKFHEVEIDDVTIQNQIKYLQDYISEHPRCHFDEVCESDPRRIAVVVLFMALLELCKLEEIHVRQHRNYSPIWLYRRNNYPAHEPKPGKYEMDESQMPDFKPGLVTFLQEEIKRKKVEQSLDLILREMSNLHTSEEGDTETAQLEKSGENGEHDTDS